MHTVDKDRSRVDALAVAEDDVDSCCQQPRRNQMREARTGLTFEKGIVFDMTVACVLRQCWTESMLSQPPRTMWIGAGSIRCVRTGHRVHPEIKE
eukprot:963074-Rhodomonas_salina.1